MMMVFNLIAGFPRRMALITKIMMAAKSGINKYLKNIPLTEVNSIIL
jgi:hypothetical protein